MRKDITREVLFDESVATIRVRGFASELIVDGVVYDQGAFIVNEVTLTKDGKTVERIGGFDGPMSSEEYLNSFKRYEFGSEVILSRVGKYQVIDKEASEEINLAIREMRAEVAAAFGATSDDEAVKLLG